MTKLFFTKHFGALRPADAAAEEALRRVKQGEAVQVEIKRPRNAKMHRKFWALMSLVHENIDHERYPTVEDLVAVIKVLTGHRTRVEMKDGRECFIPKSIAFDKLDQSGFEAFYERVLDLIAEHFLPGIEREDLRAEVESLLGMRSAT